MHSRIYTTGCWSSYLKCTFNVVPELVEGKKNIPSSLSCLFELSSKRHEGVIEGFIFFPSAGSGTRIFHFTCSFDFFSNISLSSASDLPRFSDRKSTRLNSSHLVISYAVFCLTRKSIRTERTTHA